MLLQVTIGYYRLIQVISGYFRLPQITKGYYRLNKLLQINTGYFQAFTGVSLLKKTMLNLNVLQLSPSPKSDIPPAPSTSLRRIRHYTRESPESSRRRLFLPRPRLHPSLRTQVWSACFSLLASPLLSTRSRLTACLQKFETYSNW